MKHVIIRDDDISFFTPVEVLEKLYRPLLSRGKTISLSVIPEIACGITLGEHNGPFWTEYSLNYSPFIPPEFRKRNEQFSIVKNSTLTDYLNKNTGFEILQHGYSHAVINDIFEGALSKPEVIEEKLAVSSLLLEKAFGKKPDFFVGPWDAFSSETIKELRKSFKGISMHRMGKRHVPWNLKPSAVFRRLIPRGQKNGYFKWGDFIIFEHPGTMISMFNSPKMILDEIKQALEKLDTLILVTHHWEFFYDWGKINPYLYDAWMGIIDFLLSDSDIEITNFAAMYKKIIRPHI